MPRCTTLACKSYGRDLQPDEIEFMPAVGQWVCAECFGPVTDPPTVPQSGILLSSASGSVVESTPVAFVPPPVQPVPQSSEPALQVKAQLPKVIEPWEYPAMIVTDVRSNSPGKPQSAKTQQAASRVRSGFGPPTPVLPKSDLVAPQGEMQEDHLEMLEVTGTSVFPMIIVYQGGEERGHCEVVGDMFLIGRASDWNAELPHLDFGTYTDGRKVSRRHACIYQYEGQYFVKDLGSEHGSWLNGEFLQPNVPHVLQDDDTISIAGVADLEFRLL